MKTENVLRLGQLANTLDSFVNAPALEPPESMPESLHEAAPDLVAELRAIFINETGENPWAKPVEDITQEHLVELSDSYLGEGDSFTNFHTFWINFLSEQPEPDQVTRLLKQVKDWGYVLDDDSGMA